MEFLSVTVGGFRNLKKTKILLDGSITSLVSTNNYGKSNFLDAVAFGTVFMNSTPQARVRMSFTMRSLASISLCATASPSRGVEITGPESV